MRPYSESSIFLRMNEGDAIRGQLVNSIKSIHPNHILNNLIEENLQAMYKAHHETLVLKTIEAIHKMDIILMAYPADKQFPAYMPYVKTKHRSGREICVVDLTKYATVERDSTGKITAAKVDVNKLYAITIPAYVSLTVLNEKTVISTEATKQLAIAWARLFNKVLMAQKIFVNNPERYEAFMYFAMRFFMIYYMQTPMPIVERASMEYIKKTKSNYIMMVENNIKHLNIDLYRDWETFAYLMFSNQVTNIQAVSNVEMNPEQYLSLFTSSMGKDGAFLSLWSADYFFYCLFVAWNRAYILYDRAWEAIVDEDKKLMPNIIGGIIKEI